MGKERMEMTVKLQVTVPQALALQAMFKHWNRLANMGSSRMVGFYVDGDGDFHPKCECSFSEPVPDLTPEIEKAAAIEGRSGRKDDVDFDFDGVGWILSGQA